MNTLLNQHCQPLIEGTPALPLASVQQLLLALPGWSTDPSATLISKVFRFQNYYQTMAFVNAVAWIAHQEDHHPDLEVSYNRCQVSLNTHTVKGLSENDFICAAKINYLLAERN